MNANRRATFAALADVIVPGAAGVDVAGRLLDRVLDAAPRLAAPLVAVLDEVAHEAPAAAVPWLERERPKGFELILLTVAASYLLDPGVRRRLGYPGQEAAGLPRGGEVAGEALLEPVLLRGPRWRGHGEEEEGHAA